MASTSRMAPELCEQMRSDWNQRAREDGKYYAAFGRRDQADEDFFSSAFAITHGLECELKRLPATETRRRRALEIGCGPGRLMRALSPHFGEIHGVDISDEMVRLAQEKLRDIPHAQAHHTAGSDLAAFADESFDFVYSYAVFQHLPQRGLILQYLCEARRVLKTGGLLWFQANGLPTTSAVYDTWNGVRIGAREIADFARENDFQVLALERAGSLHMWTSWRRQAPGWAARLAQRAAIPTARIQRVTQASNGEPEVPSHGRFAFAALWVEGLPEDCDLNHLGVQIGGLRAEPSYISPATEKGQQQINVALPRSVGTGLLPVELLWLGKAIAPPATVRVVPPGPTVPRLLSIADALEFTSGLRIVSRSIKVILEEGDPTEQFRATVSGLPITELAMACTDPSPPLYEINLVLPRELPAGVYDLRLQLGCHAFPPVSIEVV